MIKLEPCAIDPDVWDVFCTRRGRIHVGACVKTLHGYSCRAWYRQGKSFNADSLLAARSAFEQIYRRLPA